MVQGSPTLEGCSRLSTKGLLPKLEVAEVNPNEHGGEEGFDKGHDGHYPWLPFAGGAGEYYTQYDIPHGPEEETAFLPFPHARKDIAHGHGVVQVIMDVLVFVQVIEEHVKKRGNDTDYSHGVHVECFACQRPP
jgi:hypothetical protein